MRRIILLNWDRIQFNKVNYKINKLNMYRKRGLYQISQVNNNGLINWLKRLNNTIELKNQEVTIIKQHW